MITTPLFSVRDTVYLKESAQVGYLEAVRITHVMTTTNDQWVYNVTIGYVSPGPRLPSVPTFGDRITHQSSGVLYFTESELLSFCDAADLVESVLESRLADIRARRQGLCG